jgi:radical SAM superfamily enzyme YgiQ (UPF0313 family)
MIKVLLVVPRMSGDQTWESLGVQYIQSYLCSKGIASDIIDMQFNSMEEIKEKIEKKKYDFLGISATTSVYEIAVTLAYVAKSIRPTIKIIIGGPHITPNVKLPECFDYAVRGEGEITFYEIVR